MHTYVHTLFSYLLNVNNKYVPRNYKKKMISYPTIKLERCMGMYMRCTYVCTYKNGSHSLAFFPITVKKCNLYYIQW